MSIIPTVKTWWSRRNKTPPATDIKPPRRHWRRWLVAIIAIIIVIFLAYLWWRNRQPEATTGSQTLITISTQDLTEVIEVSGTISNANYTLVQTQAIGTVTEIFVTEGQTVKEGDKLFELELTPEGKQNNQSAYANYLQAQNNVKAAENQLNTLQATMFERNDYFIDHAVAEDLSQQDPDWIIQNAQWLASENAYKNQQQVITQARASQASAYQTYRNTGSIVYAPVSGTIENITAVVGLSFGSASNTGTNLSARLATIKTGDQALAIFDVSATDILKIDIGQQVILNSNNLAHEYTGTVVSVDRYGTVGNTTTYQVIAQFPTTSTDSESLLPNLSVDGEIIISQKSNIITVPTLALINQAGTSQVIVRRPDGSDEIRTVQTGVSSGNVTEIISGLTVGEQIVLNLPEFSNDASYGELMRSAGGNPNGPPPGIARSGDKPD